MKRTVGIAALGLGLSIWSGLGWAQTPPGRAADRQAIEAGERAWGQAFVTGDVETAKRLMDDDFLGVGVRGGLYDKASALKDMAGATGGSDTVGPITVRFFGDTAIAQAREAEVGPAPEHKPVWRVFTDTWILRDGHWRIVAAEDLDPGAPTPAAFTEDRATILALRAESNAAIAAHDLARFTPMFAEDAVFVWSNGTSAIGRAGLARFFTEDFANPAFVTYVRTPETVAVSDQGVRAVEHGTWTAIKREPRGETRYGGDYAAHWFKTAEGWRVRGELYVKLRCTGPLCAP